MYRIYKAIGKRREAIGNYQYRNSLRALTLIELLISVALISILVGAIWMVYNTGFKASSSQLTRSNVKAESGRTLLKLASEARVATSVTSAQEKSFTFTADINSDGTDETIQYLWSGTAGDPLNRVSTVTVPLLHSIDTLSFSYYNSSNNLLSFPVTASQVRLVAIDVTVIDNNETFDLTSKIKLRNL